MKACSILLILLFCMQLLLIFSKHQIMYNVSCVIFRAEVTCKRYFVKQSQSTRTKSSTRPLITSSIALDSCFTSEMK